MESVFGSNNPYARNDYYQWVGRFSSYAYSFITDLSLWVTSCVTSMQRMFENSYYFNGNVSQWDTSRVTDMSYVFSAASLFNCDVSHWNTGNF